MARFDKRYTSLFERLRQDITMGERQEIYGELLSMAQIELIDKTYPVPNKDETVREYVAPKTTLKDRLRSAVKGFKNG